VLVGELDVLCDTVARAKAYLAAVRTLRVG
jgi:hypothetical protein